MERPKNPWGQRGAGRGQRFRGAHRNENGKPGTSMKPKEEHLSSGDNPKFIEACEKMRMNIEKYIGDGIEYSSSSSEDELDDCKIIEKTFMKYDGSDRTELQKARELLQESLTSGAVVCLICIESVKRNDPIWSCENCYCILHIGCIKKWAKDSMFHQKFHSDQNDTASEKKWCCPKCRHEYKAVQTPSQYVCFCGKVENPPYDPWIIPHSCGHTCEKQLKPTCGHQCLLLCHPGPCPPCPVTVQISCFCGRSKPVTKRCCNKKWSCGMPCKKILSCKQHYCPDPCHGEECKLCTLQSQQSCLCGAERKLRPCDNLTWQCQKPCLKPLECGNHMCQELCHSKGCPPCPKLGPRPCPCAKKVECLPCTEDVSPCGDTCDKLLECGIHRCVQRCHYGPCGKCLQMRVMKCRCGQRVKSVPCCKEFLCDIKCKNKRDCGRHNCNRKCCTGNCPPCEAPCGRTVNCGSHKCQSRCHAGPCFPCKETAEIKCNCGTTKITIPCGRRKSAVPPQCSADCKLPSDCHHEERQKHRCHFGDCPPCRKICGKIHECGHSCPAKCHTAVLTKVEVKKKKEGPWDLVNAYRMQLVEKPCPPCAVPTSMICLGGHEIYEFQCHEAKSWSCDKPCGRKLLCGNHFCELQCHETGDAPDNIQSEKCEPCERPCEKQRPKDCIHTCRKPCHPNSCDPCKECIKMRCHCQLNTLYIVCNEWTNVDENKRNELKCCQSTCPKQLSCGHRCPMVCHEGLCPDRSTCKKKVTIRCKCKRIKKEIPCVAMLEFIDCDEVCLAQKEKIKADEAARKEMEMHEAKKKQELELEEFRRKTEGRKKKTKKQKETAKEETWLKEHWPYSFAVAVFSILLCYIFYFYSII